ncbi:MAG: hypothetical protein HUJ88_11380 [Fusobacterium necrophorum]|nr:hypothetical protein [Fusobacterium necrophorum]
MEINNFIECYDKAIEKILNKYNISQYDKDGNKRYYQDVANDLNVIGKRLVMYDPEMNYDIENCKCEYIPEISIKNIEIITK